MTTESLLGVSGVSAGRSVISEAGALVKGESKNGLPLERPGPLSPPSIRVMVPPWLILPPSGHCPLLSARIMLSLDKPFTW